MYYIYGMKYLLTILFTVVITTVQSQVSVEYFTVYNVPDSLNKSFFDFLPDDHPHKEIGWAVDDIYFNSFPYYETLINIDGVNSIILDIDTVELTLTKSYDYYGDLLVVSLHNIDYAIFDDGGFSVQLTSGAMLSYLKVNDEFCDLYKEMGHTNECMSQLVYINEYNELEFIVKQQYNNLQITN